MKYGGCGGDRSGGEDSGGGDGDVTRVYSILAKINFINK